MQRSILIAIVLCLVPILAACNLTPTQEEEPAVTIPVLVGGDNDPTSTPTQGVLIVTATPQATSSPTPTQFSQGNSGTGNSGSNGNSGVSPAFSDLSFSTTAAGNNLAVFSAGTQEIYARWNYSNVPVGTTMRREWYRNGQLFTTRDETWSNNWGTTGRLTHIKLFDYDEGISSGNYSVIIKLPSYGIQISGQFSVLDGAPTFDALTFSESGSGQSKTIFPYGTEEVYARWNYANIPVGATMRRTWYRDGNVVANRTEAWPASWGSGGIVSTIHIYDFDIGGLTPGNYQVIVELTDYASARVTGNFTIEGNIGPVVSNLRFATSGNGNTATTFPNGTEEVFAIFDYGSIPREAQVRRTWSRNNIIVADVTEVWDFDAYSTSGTRRDISLFDRNNGLTAGEWTVSIEIVGQPSDNARTSATFTIQDATPAPTISNLRFATTANGTTAASFPAGIQEIFGIVDYANVPADAQLRRLWYLDNTLIAERTENWDEATYGSNGTIRNISLFDNENGLDSGSYSVEYQLITPDNGILTTTAQFTIAQPPVASNLRFSDAGNGASITRFAAGTEEVFAIFDYANVPANVEISRVWYLDDVVFVEVVEDWDEATYGGSGTARDISIFDLENGLPSGNYRVEISFVGFPDSLVSNTFVIDPPAN